MVRGRDAAVVVGLVALAAAAVLLLANLLRLSDDLAGHMPRPAAERAAGKSWVLPSRLTRLPAGSVVRSESARERRVIRAAATDLSGPGRPAPAQGLGRLTADLAVATAGADRPPSIASGFARRGAPAFARGPSHVRPRRLPMPRSRRPSPPQRPAVRPAVQPVRPAAPAAIATLPPVTRTPVPPPPPAVEDQDDAAVDEPGEDRSDKHAKKDKKAKRPKGP